MRAATPTPPAQTSGEYYILLNSVGALATLVFAAPNSPLGQPRNAVGGSMISAAISVLFYYLSGEEYAWTRLGRGERVSRAADSISLTPLLLRP